MTSQILPSAATSAQDAVARRIAARLSAGSDDLPYDITERLRAARMQALARRKQAIQPRFQAISQTSVSTSNGLAVLGGGGSNDSWIKRLFASTVPIAALLIGLVVINIAQDEDRFQELADVDAELLADDLPPAAYTDAGFVQFLKTSGSGQR